MKLAIVGPGRSGKDTIANWMRQHTTLHVGEVTATSWAILPFVRPFYEKLEVDWTTDRDEWSDEEIYRRRHKDRMLWYYVGEAMRQFDRSILVKSVLRKSDVVTGIRSKGELEASRPLFNKIIWVGREDVPTDPTLEFDSNLCDVIIDNSGTLRSLHSILATLTQGWGIWKKPITG